jgi:hypothetical protein
MTYYLTPAHEAAALSAPRLDGATYDHARDGQRLTTQLQAVFNLMKDGKPRALTVIGALVGAPSASVSARLRDLRKPKFGGYRIDREYLGRGLFSYRMVLQQEEPA